MKNRVKFVGIDYWSRPVFKDEKGNYFGSLDKLFNSVDTEQKVLESVNGDDLLYFGRDFDCEPMGDNPVRELEIVRSNK